MRVPTEEIPSPLRKPDNERINFQEGEFTAFIKPYFDTLDFYHSQNIDSRTISIALKNLVDNHQDADLELVAIELRGNGLNIRYTTAPGIDKSKLSHEYYTNHAQIQMYRDSLNYIEPKNADQDATIQKLTKLFDALIDASLENKRTVTLTNISVSGGLTVDVNSGIKLQAGRDIGDISGELTNRSVKAGNNSFNNEHWSDVDRLSFDELLSQLRQVIQADIDLSDVDKSDLLEQVDSLALAKKVEVPVERETLVRKAKKIIEGTLKNIPATAKIVEACSTLLPIIMRFFDFPAT
jgi:hypothetical protein